MPEFNLNTGGVWRKTKQAFEAGNKIIIHQGGTGSGKTFDIMIFLMFYLAARQKNLVLTVVSESKPHLDIGVIRYAKKLNEDTGISSFTPYNETKAFFTFENGSILEFFSADRIEKALGARRNVLYGNEINSLKENIWDELARRSEYIIGDFNPTAPFWIDKWLKYYDHSIVIKSNHLDNPFLPETERLRILKRASVDANFKRIHIDCEYGLYEGLVYPNFEMVDEMPEPDCIGLDFGYTNSKTAAVQMAIRGEDLYINELLYESGLRNVDIIKKLKEAGVGSGVDIWCDSAEPKSIDDLYFAGLNAKPVEKTKVTEGVDMVKRFNLKVTKESVNVIRELRNYQYKQDKEGNWINEPVKDFDHAMDALRYAVTMTINKRKDYSFTINTFRGNRI